MKSSWSEAVLDSIDAELQAIRRRHVQLARIHQLPSVQPPPAQYDHMIWCSGSRLKPIGSPNNCCICQTALRKLGDRFHNLP